ncbi:MAG: hypothetical protein LBK94_01765 [Prevotellaceae bacterium]|jgi:hypothetical protein|nr:hypothetical protein [Prevotellaceae bacterium]
MEKAKIKNKSVFKGAVIGMICAICLFATAHGLSAQTIQFQGGYCMPDTVVETTGGTMGRYVRVDFKYTLDENATMTALTALLDKGQFVAGKKKYKANGIVFDAANEEEMKTNKNGTVSLTVFMPNTVKMESVKFVLGKQEVPVKQIKK